MCILIQLLNINENKNRLCNLRDISLEILSFLIYVVVYIPVFHLIKLVFYKLVQLFIYNFHVILYIGHLNLYVYFLSMI